MAHVLNGAEAEFDRGCDIGHDLFYFRLAGRLMMMSSVGRTDGIKDPPVAFNGWTLHLVLFLYILVTNLRPSIDGDYMKDVAYRYRRYRYCVLCRSTAHIGDCSRGRRASSRGRSVSF